MCAASKAIKNAQMPQLKQASAQGKFAFFRYTKLIIMESSTRGSSVSRHNKISTAGPGHLIRQEGARDKAPIDGAQARAADTVASASGWIGTAGTTVEDGTAALPLI